jgi:hypothetical protein
MAVPKVKEPPGKPLVVVTVIVDVAESPFAGSVRVPGLTLTDQL